MATMYDEIIPRHISFIERQHVFFVGTAAEDGRVNISPKGLDSLRVLSPTRIVWLNGTGSGNETAAHVLATRRMTLMFCSFEREPIILRVYGDARVVHDGDEDWDELVSLFPPMKGTRNIFDLAIETVQKSCGYGVPLMDFRGDRELMDSWAEKKGPDGIAEYRTRKNTESIDGFPTGLPPQYG